MLNKSEKVLPKESLDERVNVLSFGTGGMRGEMGSGQGQINVDAIRQAAFAVAEYIKKQVKRPKAVIAYDTRENSLMFALETARVLGSLDVNCYLFQEATPTPELSFAVIKLKADVGVVITASHNPAEYNGFKVYNEFGGQMTPTEVDQVKEYLETDATGIAYKIETIEKLIELGKITYIDTPLDEHYLEEVTEVIARPAIFYAKEQLAILYSPLHGTGDKLIPKALEKIGVTSLELVEEQVSRTGRFETVSTPNPEEAEAYKLLLERAKENVFDLLIATDPDADRLGVMCRHNGTYQLLTGNEIGLLIIDYFVSVLKEKGELKKEKLVLSTIVSSSLVNDIAHQEGFRSVRLLTGFKYIGDYIKKNKEEKNLILGFEESCGYLGLPIVYDKDSIQASLMVVEVATSLKQQKKTLLDQLELIHKKYGYVKNELETIDLDDSSIDVSTVMAYFRSEFDLRQSALAIRSKEDYLNQKKYLIDGRSEPIDLPVENVIKFFFENECWICIRPSGTENKLKFYYETKGSSNEEVKEKLLLIKSWVQEYLSESK